MRSKRIYFGVALSLLLLAFGLREVRTQTSDQDKLLARAQELASKILRSSGAKFISSSSLSRLTALSRGLSIPEGPEAARRPQVGAFPAPQSIVMVNDPTQDSDTDFDISSQSETAVAALDETTVVAYNDSGELRRSSNLNQFVGYARSTNGGSSFTDQGGIPMPETSVGLGDPGLVADRRGNFYLSQIAFDFSRPSEFASSVAISKSTDRGKTFGRPVFVPTPSAFSFQDKDFLAVDTANASATNVYVAWTSFNEDGGPIYFSRSTDQGRSFSTPIQISATDSSGSFNQGAEPTVGPKSEVYVVWFQFPFVTPTPTIQVAKSTDRGLHFDPPVMVASLDAIGFATGTLAGNFRVNSFPRIDVNPVNGEVYVVFAANPPGPDGADVFFARSQDGGATWSDPVRVNDDTTSNDQFFPDLAVNGAGTVEVFWYDRRTDPDNLKIAVWRATSSDGGRSFSPNVAVTADPVFPAVGYDPSLSPTYMGDYIDIKAVTRVGGRGLNFLLAWGDFRRIITTNGGSRGDQDVFFLRLR